MVVTAPVLLDLHLARTVAAVLPDLRFAFSPPMLSLPLDTPFEDFHARFPIMAMMLNPFIPMIAMMLDLSTSMSAMVPDLFAVVAAVAAAAGTGAVAPTLGDHYLPAA